ncbi:MAG: hypothetical protein ACRECP_12745 [Methylocella sp.]
MNAADRGESPGKSSTLSAIETRKRHHIAAAHAIVLDKEQRADQLHPHLATALVGLVERSAASFGEILAKREPPRAGVAHCLRFDAASKLSSTRRLRTREIIDGLVAGASMTVLALPLSPASETPPPVKSAPSTGGPPLVSPFGLSHVVVCVRPHSSSRHTYVPESPSQSCSPPSRIAAMKANRQIISN